MQPQGIDMGTRTHRPCKSGLAFNCNFNHLQVADAISSLPISPHPGNVTPIYSHLGSACCDWGTRDEESSTDNGDARSYCGFYMNLWRG